MNRNIMALYHSHRPQTFASVVGQEHVVTTVTNQILADTVAHAYLFSGPRGVGKTTTARLIAKAVNCPRVKDSAEPDNTHADAIAISEGRSIDVIEIDAASHTGVDHVREHIIENAQFKPTTLKLKVFIIDEVHMLSTSAFNALLKTLEEPPAHVIFILATTELHKLPKTIVSRCQHFVFKKVPQLTIVSHLAYIAKEEGKQVDDLVLHRIAKRSEGCVRDAVSLLEQVLASGKDHINADDVSVLLPASSSVYAHAFLQGVALGDATQAFTAVRELAESGSSQKQCLSESLEIMRLIIQHTLSGEPIDDELLQETATAFSGKTITDMIAVVDAMILRLPQLRLLPNPDMAFELVFAAMCPDVPAALAPTATTKPAAAPKEKPAAKKIPVETPAPEPISEPEPTPEPAAVQVPEPAATPEPKEEPAEPEAPAQINMETIRAKWYMVIKAIETISPALKFVLQSTTPTSLSGNTLKLTAEFAFHADKLKETENHKHMLTALQETYGLALDLSISVATSEKKPVDPEIHELAAAFGGSVVQ